MKFDDGSIAKIFAGEGESARFRGTGFLVTQDHVLTCAHVLFCADGEEWDERQVAIDDFQAGISLRFGDDLNSPIERRGALVASGRPDLALIRLDESVGRRPVRLVSGLMSGHEIFLRKIESSILGFSDLQSHGLIERPVAGQVWSARDFHSQRLLSVQVSGGLSPGMSGSPMVAQIEDQFVCFGMAYLGGDGRATSQLMLSGTLIDFLTQHGVPALSTIEAEDCFCKVPGQDLSRTEFEALASALRDALDRLLSSRGSGGDRKLLQENLLRGFLVVSNREQDVAMEGASGTGISFDDNRVMIQVDEKESSSIGEKLFPAAAGVAPPPPALFFVGRHRDLLSVKSLLGLDQSQQPNVVVVVEGWPGVGKSSFASVLGRDTDVTTSFPDGVLWTALGQHPNLFSSLGIWARAMGIDDILHIPSLKEAVARLQRVLFARRMLLIVDDVWDLDDITPFLGLRSDGCRLLITTRRSAVAQELTTTPVAQYRLPVLEEYDALQLLGNLAPAVVQQNRDTCKLLLRDLEYLPLAIHVAGRLLRNEARLGWGVAELLDEVRSGAAIIRQKAPEDRAEDGKIPTVSALLARSTDLLDERTRECFAYLGVFAPKPATFDLAAIAAVWQEDPKPYVRKLVGHGLLEGVPGSRFQMHALLVAHACSLFSDMN